MDADYPVLVLRCGDGVFLRTSIVRNIRRMHDPGGTW